MIENATRVICGLVRVVMGMPANSVRPADQIMPTGGQIKEFATVKVVSARDAGRPETSEVDAGPLDVDENVDALKVIVASIQFFKSPAADAVGIARYSTAAFDRAARLRQRLQMAASIELMTGAGLGLLDVGQARNLATVVDGTYESRGQLDVTFNFAHRETAEVKAILSVPLSTTLQTSDGTKTTTTEVTL